MIVCKYLLTNLISFSPLSLQSATSCINADTATAGHACDTIDRGRHSARDGRAANTLKIRVAQLHADYNTRTQLIATVELSQRFTTLPSLLIQDIRPTTNSRAADGRGSVIKSFTHSESSACLLSAAVTVIIASCRAVQ